MAISARGRTALVLILGPVLVYLALLNVTDRLSWRTAQDQISWTRAEEGLQVETFKGSALPPVVEEGALLIDISGLSVQNVDQYTEVLEALSEGSEGAFVADYTFRLHDESEVTVPVTVFLESQLASLDVVLLIVGFAFLFIGVLTYLRHEQSRGAFPFALLCVLSFVVFAFRYSGRADYFDVSVYWLSAIAFLLVPPLFVHLCTLFPRLSPQLNEIRALPYLFYVPAALLLVVHAAWFVGSFQPLGLARTPAVGHFLDRLELLHFFVGLAVGAWILFEKRRSSGRAVHRKQIGWVTAGTFLGILPFAFFYVIPFTLGLKIETWMEVSVASLTLIPLSFAYAIARFRLEDVDLFFKKGLAYVVASSLLIGFYITVALLIAQAVQELSSQSGYFFLALTALAVAAFFGPLRERIQEQLDRHFYKERYGYRRSFVDFSRTLGSEIHLPRLNEKIRDRIQMTLDVSPVAIFLRDDQHSGHFRLEAEAGIRSLGSSSTIPLPLEGLVEDGAEGGAYLLDPLVEDRSSPWRGLSEVGIRYLEPLIVRGRVIGFLGLGRKRNGDFLNSEDLDMLSTLSGYAAIAIDNAVLYRSLETKAAELLQLRMYSENVIESIDLGVAVMSADGEITVWNQGMVEFLGVPKPEAVGGGITDILPPELHQAIQEVVDGPNWIVEDTRRIYKSHVRLEKERVRLVNVTLSPFISHENVNTGTLLVFEDITQKARLESQLQQAEKLSSIGLFAAGLAHEVNTPLAGISSYSQMLLDKTPADDPRRDLLERIEKQSFRASEIVNNLLNFARFSDRDFEEVNLNSLMLETLSLLEHQFRKGKIDVEMDFDPSLPTTVGNGGKLQQVFMNLLLNARDSMPDGGALELATRREGSDLVVEVSDTGTGISKEDVKRIYDPFFTTKAVGEGTGLGLSISYGIIQEHSGRIAVDSEAGSGTTFSVRLPLKRVN